MNWTEDDLAAYLARQYNRYAYLSSPAGPATEAALRRRLCTVSKPHGWKHFHVHDSRRSEEGWPDDIWIRPGEMLAMELKIRPRQPTAAQLVWISLLATVPGVEARVIYPGEDEQWLLARLQQPGLTPDDDTPEDRAVALLGRLGWTCTPPKYRPAEEEAV